jgi:hypothetical protein
MPLPLHPATLWLWSLSAPPTEMPGPSGRAKAIEVSDSRLSRSSSRSTFRSSRRSIPFTPNLRIESEAVPHRQLGIASETKSSRNPSP